MVQIYSDDTLLFSCSNNFVSDERLCVGYIVNDIEELKYKAIMSLIEYKVIEFCASQLVNTHKAIMQIKKYEMKWKCKLHESDTDKIIEKLRSLFLLNEEMYLKSKAEKYIALKKGRNYIAQKLMQEGASRIDIENLFQTLNVDEEMKSNLKMILDKKRVQLEKKYSGTELKNRLINFGLTRGFTMNQIKELL